MKIKTIVIFIIIFFVVNKINAQPNEVEAFSTSIIVSSIDASVEWYTKNLGLKIRNELENKERGSKIVNLKNSNLLIELIKINSSIDKNETIKNYPEGSRFTGFMKIGFVVNNFDEWHQFLENQNVKFRGTIVTDGHSGKRTFLVEDPDDNVIQFFEK